MAQVIPPISVHWNQFSRVYSKHLSLDSGSTMCYVVTYLTEASTLSSQTTVIIVVPTSQATKQ